MGSRCHTLFNIASFCLFAICSLAQAQVPADPYSYTRTSSFTYYGASDGALSGLLKSETIEPGNPQSCVVTTYGYGNDSSDGYGAH